MSTDARLKYTADQPLQILIDNYLEYFALNSRHTAKAKRLDLDKFLSFLTGHLHYKKTEDVKGRDWTKANIEAFVLEILDYESPATVARRLATIKHMGRSYADRNTGFINPATEVKPPKLTKALPNALSDDEIEYILERITNTPATSFKDLRNHLLLQFLLHTGLRLDEVRTLKIKQLTPDLEWANNIRTKGKRYRNVYIDSSLRPLLSEYLKERQQQLQKSFANFNEAVNQRLPLFINIYKSDLTNPPSLMLGQKTIWRIINNFGKQFKLHPHKLRHTFAVGLLNSSNDIRLVSQALGHGDVRVTMRYTERSDQDIADAIEEKVRK